jgi:hypothetical protein
MDTASQLFVAVGPPSDEDDDVEYVEANAREVAAWLHAHPAEAVEIVRGLKVAGPWAEWNCRYAPNPDIPNGDYDYIGEQTVAIAFQHGPYAGGIPAKFGYHILNDPGPVYIGTSIGEAKAACDAALVAAGWSLA